MLIKYIFIYLLSIGISFSWGFYEGRNKGRQETIDKAYEVYKKQIWNEHPVMMRQDTGIQHSCMKGSKKRR